MYNGIIHRRIRRIGLYGAVLILLILVNPVPMSIAQDTGGDGIAISSAAAGETTFTQTTINIPTYPYASYLSEQTNTYYNISYPALDMAAYMASNPTPSPRDYDLLVMENDYIKVTILPELGGRIYQFIDKTTGHNHFYQNPVIKPTGWGPEEQRGWLAVGGIEWGLPVEEHGYEWGIPWSWSVITSTTGVTVTVRDTNLDDRIRAVIAIGLPHDRAYMVVAPNIENPTSTPITYKFWLNALMAPGAANKPGGNTQWIFNADEMAVHSTGDTRLPGAWQNITGPDYRFSWPEYNSVDYSTLHNLDQWLGFFEYPQAAADFIGIYDHDSNEGVVRVFPSDIARGTKGFSYGGANPIPWSEWTDEDSSGVEIHGGVAPTFWDSAVLNGWETLSWSEVWYPVGNVGTVTEATRESTFGLEKQGDNLEINLQTTREWSAGVSRLFVWDRASCLALDYQELPSLIPGAQYHTVVALGGRVLEAVAVAHVDADDSVLAAFGPSSCLNYTLPELHLSTSTVSFITEFAEPQILTKAVTIENIGYGTLTWTANLAPESYPAGLGFTPDLPMTSGDEDSQLQVVVNTSGVAVGTYNRIITITGHSDGTTVLESPQTLEVVLRVVPELDRVYIPVITRRATSTAPLDDPAVPHGPSKIGIHAIGEGGTLDFIRQVTNGGAQVALVKGLSFGYLCDIKDISPGTVTIGRWADTQYEAMVPVGDPATKAAEYMHAHMQQWSEYRDCVDYWEVLNESDPPEIAGHVWLAQFFKACMDIAKANSYKLALFSYSMGVPEIYEWQAIAETGVFARAQQGGHILSLHEYSWPGLTMDVGWGEPLPQYPGQDPNDPDIPLYPDRGNVIGRYRHLYRDILIPRGEAIPLAITEVNLMIYDTEIRDPIFLEEMAWYDDRLREDDYVLGMAIFTLGGGSGWDTFDYSKFLPNLADRVISLKNE